ncbi:MAG: aldo/keto reductase, partial [Selenomonas sp.]|uniref:aldo/keto reductase n=1 Tax=Selenomonas sp. TaxID=2053611 RepID=UPI0025FD165F
AEDSYAKLKYDGTAEADEKIILRVAELADTYGVSMTEIALAWLLTKVTAPVAGATKCHHIDGAVKAVELEFAKADIAYLEECYIPHELVGVMAQNTESGNKITVTKA